MQGNPGVEAGNRFADTAVALELIEAAEARKAYAPAVPLDGAEALIRELKVEPTAGPVAADGTVWVIDWSMWAAAAERHLINSINARDTHLGNVVSLQPEAEEFRSRSRRRFRGCACIRSWPSHWHRLSRRRDPRWRQRLLCCRHILNWSRTGCGSRCS